MNILRAILPAIGAVLLASCGGKVQCTDDGQIIIPPSASAKDRAKWGDEDALLALNRVRAGLDDPRAGYANIKKAPSCP